MLYQYHDITVRLLTDDDADLLVRWLRDPRVLEYFDGRDRPFDFEMVRKHFYERAIEITQCIVQYEAKDIGYIQFYPISAEEIEKYGYADFPGTIYGMDQFIGEPEYWNRGIGTELVKSMISHLIHCVQADKIVLDPQTWNKRALRVYEKCGFKKVKLLPENEWHEGEFKDGWLMEYVS